MSKQKNQPLKASRDERTVQQTKIIVPKSNSRKLVDLQGKSQHKLEPKSPSGKSVAKEFSYDPSKVTIDLASGSMQQQRDMLYANEFSEHNMGSFINSKKKQGTTHQSSTKKVSRRKNLNMKDVMISNVVFVSNYTLPTSTRSSKPPNYIFPAALTQKGHEAMLQQYSLFFCSHIGLNVRILQPIKATGQTVPVNLHLKVNMQSHKESSRPRLTKPKSKHAQKVDNSEDRSARNVGKSMKSDPRKSNLLTQNTKFTRADSSQLLQNLKMFPMSTRNHNSTQRKRSVDKLFDFSGLARSKDGLTLKKQVCRVGPTVAKMLDFDQSNLATGSCLDPNRRASYFTEAKSQSQQQIVKKKNRINNFDPCRTLTTAGSGKVTGGKSGGWRGQGTSSNPALKVAGGLGGYPAVNFEELLAKLKQTSKKRSKGTFDI